GWGRWPLAAVLAAVGLALGLGEFEVVSPAMSPTLLLGDHVLVSRAAYRFGRAPEPGDIILFESPKQPGRLTVSRVVGGANGILVAGDDRSGFAGAVPLHFIKGRVLLRFAPLGRFGTVHG